MLKLIKKILKFREVNGIENAMEMILQLNFIENKYKAL
jgi:hypothetical protein